MGQLELEGIDAQRADSPLSFVLGILFWQTRWAVTCGFCRTRFRGWCTVNRTSLVCPACGTRNLLPHHSKLPQR